MELRTTGALFSIITTSNRTSHMEISDCAKRGSATPSSWIQEEKWPKWWWNGSVQIWEHEFIFLLLPTAPACLTWTLSVHASQRELFLLAESVELSWRNITYWFISLINIMAYFIISMLYVYKKRYKTKTCILWEHATGRWNRRASAGRLQNCSC